MKKIAILAFCFIISLAMVSCGNSNTSAELSKKASTISETQDIDLESSEVNGKKGNEKVDEEANKVKETTQKLTDEEVEEAKQEALDYYKNTVFEVNSIEYVKKKKGDCAFSVNVSKDGVVQEPNRTIYLKLNKDGRWKVIGEGY